MNYALRGQVYWFAMIRLGVGPRAFGQNGSAIDSSVYLRGPNLASEFSGTLVNFLRIAAMDGVAVLTRGIRKVYNNRDRFETGYDSKRCRVSVNLTVGIKCCLLG